VNDLSRNELFRPTASWDRLRLGAELLRRLRSFFDQRGFLEVTTPLLSADTVVDRHLDPLRVRLFADPRDPDKGRLLYLQTSPELHMKRLLAAGAEAIYQVTHAFRGAEQGTLHNPEFTMAEWYRRGDTMNEGIELLDELCQVLLGRGPCQRISYRQALVDHAGVDPLVADLSQLRTAVNLPNTAALPADAVEDRDSLLDRLLAEHVQPHLGREAPVILFDYPASQAALARLSENDPRVAERFELFVDGIELANGCHELIDADELRRRNRHVNDQRQRDGKPPLPEDSQLLQAMEYGLPPCTGVALGLDRVVMLCAGDAKLADVLTFPIDRA
jgi:lysyl-tRNA synthetase class 2